MATWTFMDAKGNQLDVTYENGAFTFTVAENSGAFSLNSLWLSDGNESAMLSNKRAAEMKNAAVGDGSGDLADPVAWDYSFNIANTIGRLSAGQSATVSAEQLGLSLDNLSDIDSWTMGVKAGNTRLVDTESESDTADASTLIFTYGQDTDSSFTGFNLGGGGDMVYVHIDGPLSSYDAEDFNWEIFNSADNTTTSGTGVFFGDNLVYFNGTAFGSGSANGDTNEASSTFTITGTLKSDSDVTIVGSMTGLEFQGSFPWAD